ncbi:MAG TPA: metalloregulator ArsR/SmtB family transcription factor [Lapillicoccus sp.]|nr:metalloregulator ArsR/SmtB family transcription factor [Lapillicoccus sp.]
MSTDGVDERWGALADGTRRTIVERLVERPQAVGELADGLPVSRSAVSQHLKVLKDAGLVSERPEGTRRIYRVNPAALVALRDQLDTYWRRTLTSYAALLEGPESEES